MHWVLLLVAGLLEVGFTTCMKLSEGFTRPRAKIGFAVCAVASFLFLNRAARGIPLGTAYAVWTGIGAARTALIGMAYFKDPADLRVIVLLCVLVASVIGLKVVSPH